MKFFFVDLLFTSVLLRMNKTSVNTPCKLSYNTMLNIYGKTNNWEKSLSLFNGISIEKDIISYNSVLNALKNSKKYSACKTITLNLTQSQNIKLNNQT